MPRPRRRLTVIAALDVAGYSELMQRDEIGTLAALRSIFRRLVLATLSRHDGTVIKTLGDGLLLEFPSVLDAVEWTLAFQGAMFARNADPAQKRIDVRAAIVLADVIVSEDDRFGAAIGFANRLQEAAPPGGIAITHSVRWQLLGEPANAFKPVGFVRLRSIPYPVETWMWAPEGIPLPTAAPTETQRATPGVLDLPHLKPQEPSEQRPLLVVLPYDSLSSDPDVAHFADGVVEETTATLSRLREISVVARNSAFTYKGRPTDVRALKEELGVRYVLEGSVRKAGDQLRVTSQLIEVESGAHLWSGRMDGALSNAFALQDEVATQVAGALHSAIRAAEIERAKRKSADGIKARDLVLRALPHFWAHRREDNEAALVLLDQALGIDADYPPALALKAWCLAQQVTYLWSKMPMHDRGKALEFAEEAVATASDDPLVYTAVGATLSILNTDQSRALFFIERAISLDSTFAWAWTRAGYAKAYSGRVTEAIEAFRTAIRLSPHDPIQFNAFAGLATCHFMLGEHAEAARWAAAALDGRPGMVWANRLLATAAALAGDLPTARRAVDRLLAAHPGLTLEDVRDGIHNLEPADLDRYIEGLRLAGLPEACDDQRGAKA